jgi:hypothetical protein
MDTEMAPKATNDSHQTWVLAMGNYLAQKAQRRFSGPTQTLGGGAHLCLARDYEVLPNTSGAFIWAASVRLLLKRLALFSY